jgi:hypothetical protein
MACAVSNVLIFLQYITAVPKLKPKIILKTEKN